ncbi:LysR family transcriptional regulator [Roseobacteraceae bacterium S113]
MQRTLPPLTWFRAFEAAARHLSFTRAGDELGLTQSAISQHVRALEAHLEQPLFIRAHRRLQLTEAGRLLMPDVAAALSQLGHATERFRPQSSRATLTLATSASVAEHIIAPNIKDLQGILVGITLDIVTTIWPDDFTATKADVEMRFGRAEMVGRGAELLEPSALIAVAAPDLATEGAPLIQPVGIATRWSDIRPGAAPHFRVDTHGMAVDLALGGAGIALTHCQIAAPALRAGRLVDLGWGRWPAQEGYHLALNPCPHPEAQQALATWLRAQMQPEAT